jgi:hypothetical protein
MVAHRAAPAKLSSRAAAPGAATSTGAPYVNAGTARSGMVKRCVDRGSSPTGRIGVGAAGASVVAVVVVVLVLLPAEPLMLL